MAHSRSQEMAALNEYRQAMDAVAEKDALWRELIQQDNVSRRRLEEAFRQLKGAWLVWVAAYSKWVREHANARIDEANKVLGPVDKSVDS